MSVGQQNPLVARGLENKLTNFFRREELFATHVNFREALEKLILFLTSLSNQEISTLVADHDIYVRIDSKTPFANIQWYRKSVGAVIVAVYENISEDENPLTGKPTSEGGDSSLFTRETTIPLAFLLKLAELSKESGGSKLDRMPSAKPASTSSKPRNVKAVELLPPTAENAEDTPAPSAPSDRSSSLDPHQGTEGLPRQGQAHGRIATGLVGRFDPILAGREGQARSPCRQGDMFGGHRSQTGTTHLRRSRRDPQPHSAFQAVN